jgi:hypothetical protein
MLARCCSVIVTLLLLYPWSSYAFDPTLPSVDQRATFEVTETVVIDHHVDNFDGVKFNDNYSDVRNRLNLSLGVGDLTLAARIDTATFVEPPVPERLPYLDRYGLEKLWGTYQSESFQLSLGDFYASFGRGIALRIRKVDELGQDTTLLGAKVRIQTSQLGLTALAGLSNPTNSDLVNEKTLADPYDLLSGLRANWRLPHAKILGFHGVAVLFDPLERNDQSSRLPERAFVVGSSFQVLDLGEQGNLFAEFDWLGRQFQDPVTVDEPLQISHSWAAYLSWNLFLDNVTMMLEAKSYNDFDLYGWTPSNKGKHYSERLEYICPPTLEPEEMEVANNQDVSGVRVGLDWRPGGTSTLLFASYAGFLAHDLGTDQLGDRWIYHVRAGAEQELLRRGKAKLAAGLREEQPDYGGGQSQSLRYVNATIKIPISVRHSLNLDGFNWWYGRVLKGEWKLGYAWAPFFDVSVIFSYDTTPSSSRSLREFHKTKDGTRIRQVFLAGSLQVSLWGDRAIFRGYAGSMRGGLKCMAGGCRYIAPFAGARLETVLRL